MTSVQEIRRIDDLARWRSDWRALLARTPGASFFQSLEWLETYWRYHGPGQELRTLVVSDDEGPVGILPLVVRREKFRVGSVRVLTYPLNDWGSFYGPIGPNAQETLKAGLDYVRRSRRDWDIVDLRWVGAPDTNPRHTAKAMHAAGWQAYRTVWDRTAVVDLEGTWDNYLASKTSKWRSGFHRNERKLDEQGRIGFVRHCTAGCTPGQGDPRWDLYDACEKIAQASWQGTSTTGTTLSHASVRPFLRAMHETAARHGSVDLALLTLDEQPVAFAYNHCFAGYVFGLRAGYDRELAPRGAGSLLMTYVLRDSFERGDRVYDLGVGSLQVKRPFLTRLVPIYRFSHFHPGAPRAQLMRLKRWAETRFAPEEGGSPLVAGVPPVPGAYSPT